MKKIILLLTYFALSLAAGAFYIASALAAPLSPQEMEQLKAPHGRIFYLYSKEINVNIREQMTRERDIILEGGDYPLAIAVLDQVLELDKENSEVRRADAIKRDEEKKRREEEALRDFFRELFR